MALGIRGEMSLLQLTTLNHFLPGGIEFRIAERLNAIELASDGGQVIRLEDDEEFKFGTGSGVTSSTDYDVKVAFDAAQLEMLPRTDDLCAFNIGDGTTDMDFKVFMGSTTSYVLFDNSTSVVEFEEAKLRIGAAAGATAVTLAGTDPDQVLSVHGVLAAAAASGFYVAGYNTLTITASQTNNVSAFGTMSELYITGDVSLIANHAAVWANLEMADAGGTLTLPGGTAWQAALCGTVIAPDGLLLSPGGELAGLYIQSMLTAGYTATSATVAGIIVNLNSGSAVWPTGLFIADSSTTTGISLGDATTGISFAGDFTDCITFGGTVTGGKCIDFAGVTMAAGSSNNLISYGDGVAALDVTITDYWFPIRLNVASIANPATEKLASLLWLKFATTTAHQANLDIQGIGCTVELTKNVGYAHAIEGLVDVTTSLSTTTGTIIGGKFGVDLSSGATLTHGVGDNLSAVCALVTGTGTYTGGMVASVIEARKESATAVDNGLWVNVLTGATITNGVHFGGAGTITHAIRFDSSAVTVGTGISAHGGTLKTVRCDIDGTDYYLILSTAPS